MIMMMMIRYKIINERSAGRGWLGKLKTGFPGLLM